MPDIVKKDIDALNAELTVKISKADYEQKFSQELNNYRKKAQLKGFRKGKAPMSFIKRTYGQGILIDLVNKQLQDEMGKYLEEEKLNLLGQPIPSESQVQFTFDIKDLEDFEFKFDIGLAPEFDFKNVDDTTKLPYYKIKVSDDMAREDLDKARRRMGNQELVEEDINEEDIIRVAVQELDGKDIKEGGVSNDFSVVVKDLGDEYLKQIKGKAKNFELDLDIYQFEKDRDAKHINKYLLGLEEETIPEGMGNMFRGKITEINRIVLADLNEEFFKNYFGNDEIKDERAALDQLKEDIAKFYEKESDTLLFVQLQNELRNLNALSLPDDFLQRWLVSSSEENTPEKVKEGYDDFAKNLKWTLIQNELAKSFNIEVSEEDIDKVFMAQVQQYLGAYANEEFTASMLSRLKQDREQVNKAAEQVVGQKIFEQLKSTVNLEDNMVEMDDLREIAKEIYQAE
ncbi:MAG: hypothetical protein HKN39_04555 [Flavobacteriales bacterium]|nr:hypothetical protein [Flavobacteriales bacterium]